MMKFGSSSQVRASQRGKGIFSDGSLSRLTITLELSPPMIIASVIGLVVILAWVFVFGVIVGRGYNPETRMPGAGLLSSSEEETPHEEDDIIRAEDLNFMTELKEPVGAAQQSHAVSGKKEQKTGQSAAAGTQVPESRNLPARVAESKPDDNKPVFDYVYQVVAYKNQSLANTAKARLEAKGMKTRVAVGRDASGKPRWYRLQVMMRGTVDDDLALRRQLAEEGMTSPLLLSRNGVKSKKK